MASGFVLSAVENVLDEPLADKWRIIRLKDAPNPDTWEVGELLRKVSGTKIEYSFKITDEDKSLIPLFKAWLADVFDKAIEPLVRYRDYPNK